MNPLLPLVLMVSFASTAVAANPVQSFAQPPKPSALEQLARIGQARPFKAACCKVCRKGKACGNSCISRSYACRKGAGCACDG